MVCCERVVRVSQWECGSGVGEKEDEKLDDSGVLVSKQQQPRSAAESTFESVSNLVRTSEKAAYRDFG